MKASELVTTSRKRNCCNNGRAQDTDSLESLKKYNYKNKKKINLIKNFKKLSYYYKIYTIIYYYKIYIYIRYKDSFIKF